MIARLLDYTLGWVFFGIGIFSVLAVIQMILDFNSIDLVRLLS